MDIKIKLLHPEAKMPTKAYEGDAGYDIYAVDSGKVDITASGDYVTYKTGIALAIPEDHVGLLFCRSSIGNNTTLMLSNAVGVLDSTYRGEVIFKFRDVAERIGKKYHKGDRIGQLVVMPISEVKLVQVTELDVTERGEKGYGSSGK